MRRPFYDNETAGGRDPSGGAGERRAGILQQRLEGGELEGFCQKAVEACRSMRERPLTVMSLQERFGTD